MLSFITQNAKTLCAVAALSLGATAAVADVHTIIIFEDAYFPEVSYVKPGDTVIFENESDMEQGVAAANESWAVPPIAVGSTAEMVITPNMHASFLNPEFAGTTGDFNYDDPPLN